jgi:hypothetical protein
MPAKKSKSVADTIQQAMPGWRVVPRPASDAIRARARASASRPDAVSPSLAAQQTKYFGGTKTIKNAKKKAAARKHAKFVTVVPASQPDSARAFQKVVLIRDGKVVAQQG